MCDGNKHQVEEELQTRWNAFRVFAMTWLCQVPVSTKKMISELRRDQDSHFAKMDPLSDDGGTYEILERVVMRVFAAMVVE
jgi:hypothetical protein